MYTISRSRADLFYFTISQSYGGNIRDLLILKLLDIQKKKVLIHLHGGNYRTLVDGMGKWQKKMNYNAISKVWGTIVLGPSLRWIFEGMIPDKRIFTVPNCVDDQYLMDEDCFCRKVKRSGQRRINHVLYLSNFIRSKGYIEVLEMARMERKNVLSGGEKKLHFDFAGRFFEKSEKRIFDRYVAENKLEDYVTYHRIVDGKEKQELLENSDFFVLLTTFLREGQPISILEAMGNGLVLDKKTIDPTRCYEWIRELSDKDFEQIMKTNRAAVVKGFRQEIYIQNVLNSLYFAK